MCLNQIYPISKNNWEYFCEVLPSESHKLNITLSVLVVTPVVPLLSSGESQFYLKPQLQTLHKRTKMYKV